MTTNTIKKPNTKDFVKALRNGVSKLNGRKADGALFEWKDGRLCGCALGAVALGSGMITLDQAKAIGKANASGDNCDVDIDEDQIIEAFPEWNEAGRTVESPLFSSGALTLDSIAGQAQSLNDDTALSLSEIAKKLEEMQHLKQCVLKHSSEE